MKTKLLQIKGYLFLIDEKAEINNKTDYVVCNTVSGYKWLYAPNKFFKDLNKDPDYWKIIGYYPLKPDLKELDLPELPPFEEKNYSLAKKLNEIYGILKNQGIFSSARKEILKAENLLIQAKIQVNEQAAQSKQFSLEDVIDFVEWTNLHYRDLEHTKAIKNVKDTKELFNYYLSLSIQQLPKEFIPEYNFKQAYYKILNGKKILSIFNLVDDNFKDIGLENNEMIRNVPISDIIYPIKTITNSKGKKELVGKYKY